MTRSTLQPSTRIAFIGAGNMASALASGLIRHGVPPAQLLAVDPAEEARNRLHDRLGVTVLAAPDATLGQSDLVVWAVKPQSFRAAAQLAAPHVGQTAQLSIMAGIRLHDLVDATHANHIVRCMPNTPALIGHGMTALFAPADVSAADRNLAEAVMRCAGDTIWVEREEHLDAVTALSGSGPAYVFYFLEAMQQAGTELGLTAAQARQLAQQTFAGSAALAAGSEESLGTLRQRVTSKGGTTFAALTSMEQSGIQSAFVQAMHAACTRAKELGDEFGRV
ncbi:MAG: pyrroline-5-carboxylate reductase [Burkholderiaceae bacterium]|nr:MAG: pyrroline-5-carboxylate reductase [Burkholderiaceae bacterium]